MNYPDTRLTLTAQLLTSIAERFTQAVKLLRLLEADGYPTTASGADTGTRGGGPTITVDGERVPVTGVEAAAINRITASERLDLEAHATGILRMSNNLAKELDRILGRNLEAPAQCDGRGLEGFPDWGEACNRPADKAGLCHKHYMRCYRWRTDHNLGPLGSAA